MAVHTPNTIESLRIACAEKGWDGYDAEPMPEILKNLLFSKELKQLDLIFQKFLNCFQVLMVHFNGNGTNTERTATGI